VAREVIVILDRESNIQWALKTLLEDEGCIVLSVNTVERVMKGFSEFEISALITEYRVDHSSTVEMVRRIKLDFPEVYIMMLTDCLLKENEYEEAIEAGVDDLFFKPVSMKKVMLHLRKGLNQRNVLRQRNRLKSEMNQNEEREDEPKDRRAKGALLA
jgi:DNA-binding response OmpR family regulator